MTTENHEPSPDERDGPTDAKTPESDTRPEATPDEESHGGTAHPTKEPSSTDDEEPTPTEKPRIIKSIEI